MGKDELEPLFKSYVGIVRYQRIWAANPGPAMYAASIKTGILDHIREVFKETKRLPEGKQKIRKRGYGGGRCQVEFPTRFRWVGSGYMCLIDW